MAQCAPDTTAPKPTATNLNNQHWNNLGSTGKLFKQAAACEHLALPAPPAPVKKDVHCEHMLSYVNKPDIGAALKQAQSELEQDQQTQMNFQHERPLHLDHKPLRRRHFHHELVLASSSYPKEILLPLLQPPPL
ncbi:hypothetical protein C0995_015816 [Termitomyces sp. Mi166|nr:hypothetical protein C0995_015816 [Termitomyces sp. Mi166\